jgi:thiamine-phosphate pyrophosphorylase
MPAAPGAAPPAPSIASDATRVQRDPAGETTRSQRDPAGDATRHASCAVLRVVAITDRRLMVPADVLAAGDWAAITRAFGDAVGRAVAGCPPGTIAVQVREKDLDGGPLLALVRAAQAVCDRVLVNDRLDVALAAGAYGVHLPERGLALADARRLAPSLVLGASRHLPTASAGAGAAGGASAAAGAATPSSAAATPPSAAATPSSAAAGIATPPSAAADITTPSSAAAGIAAPSSAAIDTSVILASAAAAGADLIQLGPIWPTPSKPGAPTLGPAVLGVPRRAAALVAAAGDTSLRSAVRAIDAPSPPVTLVAVGGIDNPARAEAAAAAGADAVAVIRAAWTGASLTPFIEAVARGLAARAAGSVPASAP